MVGKAPRILVDAAILWAGLLLTGCSLSPSTKLTLFPSGHQMTDAAKELRQPVPAALPRSSISKCWLRISSSPAT